MSYDIGIQFRLNVGDVELVTPSMAMHVRRQTLSGCETCTRDTYSFSIRNLRFVFLK